MLHIEEEAARCLRCADAPCSNACKTGDPARAIRAIRFGNGKLAGRWVAECTDEDLEAAERACIHYDRPIRIREMLNHKRVLAHVIVWALALIKIIPKV